MAKIAKKLTDTEIKSTKPADKEINLFDGDGLILRIAPLAKGGKKNWYFRYAVPVSKKRTKMSLGTYPHLTLARARALRDEYLSLLANGIDPQVHNNNKANALKNATEHTLQTVARKWLDEKVKTSGISQDHAEDIWRSLERNIFPGLGNVPINEIRPKLLKQHLDPIEQRGVLETLRRIISRLNEIFVMLQLRNLSSSILLITLGNGSVSRRNRTCQHYPFRTPPLPGCSKQCFYPFRNKATD
jgi:hypothetical protein